MERVPETASALPAFENRGRGRSSEVGDTKGTEFWKLRNDWKRECLKEEGGRVTVSSTARGRARQRQRLDLPGHWELLGDPRRD